MEEKKLFPTFWSVVQLWACCANKFKIIRIHIETCLHDNLCTSCAGRGVCVLASAWCWLGVCVCDQEGDRHTLSSSASSVTAGRPTNTRVQMPVQRLTSTPRYVCFVLSGGVAWCMCRSPSRAPSRFLLAWSVKRVNRCYPGHMGICLPFQKWNNFICQEEINGPGFVLGTLMQQHFNGWDYSDSLCCYTW